MVRDPAEVGPPRKLLPTDRLASDRPRQRDASLQEQRGVARGPRSPSALTAVQRRGTARQSPEIPRWAGTARQGTEHFRALSGIPPNSRNPKILKIPKAKLEAGLQKFGDRMPGSPPQDYWTLQMPSRTRTSASTSGGRGEGFAAETAVGQHRAILGWPAPPRSPRKSRPGGRAERGGKGRVRHAPCTPGETRVRPRLAERSASPLRREGKPVAASPIEVSLWPPPTRRGERTRPSDTPAATRSGARAREKSPGPALVGQGAAHDRRVAPDPLRVFPAGTAERSQLGGRVLDTGDPCRGPRLPAKARSRIPEGSPPAPGPDAGLSPDASSPTTLQGYSPACAPAKAGGRHLTHSPRLSTRARGSPSTPAPSPSPYPAKAESNKSSSPPRPYTSPGRAPRAPPLLPPAFILPALWRGPQPSTPAWRKGKQKHTKSSTRKIPLTSAARLHPKPWTTSPSNRHLLAPLTRGCTCAASGAQRERARPESRNTSFPRPAGISAPRVSSSSRPIVARCGFRGALRFGAGLLQRAPSPQGHTRAGTVRGRTGTRGRRASTSRSRRGPVRPPPSSNGLDTQTPTTEKIRAAIFKSHPARHIETGTVSDDSFPAAVAPRRKRKYGWGSGRASGHEKQPLPTPRARPSRADPLQPSRVKITLLWGSAPPCSPSPTPTPGWTRLPFFFSKLEKKDADPRAQPAGRRFAHGPGTAAGAASYLMKFVPPRVEPGPGRLREGTGLARPPARAALARSLLARRLPRAPAPALQLPLQPHSNMASSLTRGVRKRFRAPKGRKLSWGCCEDRQLLVTRRAARAVGHLARTGSGRAGKELLAQQEVKVALAITECAEAAHRRGRRSPEQGPQSARPACALSRRGGRRTESRSLRRSAWAAPEQNLVQKSRDAGTAYGEGLAFTKAQLVWMGVSWRSLCEGVKLLPPGPSFLHETQELPETRKSQAPEATRCASRFELQPESATPCSPPVQLLGSPNHSPELCPRTSCIRPQHSNPPTCTLEPPPSDPQAIPGQPGGQTLLAGIQSADPRHCWL
ncbi:PREDICTED: nascent polypeptide-associated complex subunit alpha, muscle-specific form-like [Chinchilla lanigera]|uniref:nascent polypeptide-associated complex subunit alpha, muscle-specific form-like n=1 Tax=Chinchilla lanigera TaxID=34839 RepID=UPI00069766CE|nr:PREDICTED: nascent polypeptide-associated complex subunit alpha, muscle-specific form-like [Chinchilla lanigera]